MYVVCAGALLSLDCYYRYRYHIVAACVANISAEPYTPMADRFADVINTDVPTASGLLRAHIEYVPTVY